MKKLLSTALAGALAVATLLPAAPALAQGRDRGGDGMRCPFGNCLGGGDRFSGRDRGPSLSFNRNWDDDWRWRQRRGDWRGGPSLSFNRNWDDDWRWRHRRGDWRWRHRDRFDGGAGFVLGFTAGALASGLASTHARYPGSYEACAAGFRSFDPATWTYLGYDGLRHRCPY